MDSLCENMPNDTINALIEERIDSFKSAFLQTAKVLFRDDSKQNKLKHPGEFGTYREAVTADFLSAFLPQRFQIDSGFVVNCDGGVSRQIDIVVYDSELSPPLESRQRQRFFPIETVVAVGEIRSALTRERLIDGLHRLSEVKRLREGLGPAPTKRWWGLTNRNYDPATISFDQVFTFLVCSHFDCDLSLSMKSTFDEIYGNFDFHQRHNAILSLADGLLHYCGAGHDGVELDASFPVAPVSGTRFRNKWIRPEGNEYLPLKVFASNLFMHACHCTTAAPDLGEYSVTGKHHFVIDTPASEVT